MEIEKFVDKLRFMVIDTGKGIVDETLKQISSPKNDSDIGIALCHKYLSMMHSELKISTRVDFGSQVWFDIPFKISGVKNKRHNKKLLSGLKITDEINAVSKPLIDLDYLTLVSGGNKEGEQELSALFFKEVKRSIYILNASLMIMDNLLWKNAAHRLKIIASNFGATHLMDLAFEAELANNAHKAVKRGFYDHIMGETVKIADFINYEL